MRWLAGSLLLIVAAGGATLAVIRHRPGGEPVARESTQVQTVKLERRDLSTTKKLDGSIGFGTPRPLDGHVTGTVTWLPAVGATIRRGQQLFRADDKPVTLFYGGIPLFRAIAGRELVGRDVRIVVDNLKALGYDVGHQPATGERVTRPATGATDGDATKEGAAGEGADMSIKVKEDEAVLTTGLVRAIKKWQEDIGRPVTGEIAVGEVEVMPGAVRVDSVAVQPGSAANAQLMTITPTRKVITASAALNEAAALRRGDRVTVTLPDDRTVKARILAIGRTPVAPQSGATDGEPKLTVSVTVDDPRTINSLDGGDAAVNVIGKTAHNVLAAPIEALIALREGGYAVQGPAGLVAVTTGMFADGFVEISGEGLTEGMDLVVTS